MKVRIYLKTHDPLVLEHVHTVTLPDNKLPELRLKIKALKVDK